MLNIITNRKEIAEAQKLLQQQLFEQLPERDREYTIGYQGGNLVFADLHADHKIWFIASIDEERTRYLNTFCLSNKLKIGTSNSIAVEINISSSGYNGRVAGLFARGDDDSIYLLHTGKIGGGRSGIGKEAFLKWGKFPLTSVLLHDNNSIEAILIGKLNSKNHYHLILLDLFMRLQNSRRPSQIKKLLIFHPQN